VKRALVVAFAVFAYVWFVADVVWAVAFLADVPVLTAIDHGPRVSTAAAIAVDVALFAAFAVHHSVMARDGAKRVLTRVVPAAAERSTYVVGASALLALILWQWRPIDGRLWDIQAQPWRHIIWAAYGLGWALVVASTFMIDHLDFVGLRQATTRPGGYRPPPFRERWLYAWVRHPLVLGLLIAVWVTPSMSVGHLLFATGASGYIAIGLRLEERDLRRHLGEPYQEYARRTPALVPGWRGSRAHRAGHMCPRRIHYEPNQAIDGGLEVDQPGAAVRRR
jgi:protein-S-isoprenylcysteine O-methyltransferase Ste14